MRIPVLLALAATFAAAAIDLPAQGRGRRGQRPPEAGAAAPETPARGVLSGAATNGRAAITAIMLAQIASG